LSEQVDELNARLRKLREQVRFLSQKLNECCQQTTLDDMNRASDDRPAFDGLSIILAYFDIPEQIERTLVSCSPAYQGADSGQIEVIVVDNGSPQPFPQLLRKDYPVISKVVRVDGRPSPVTALNQAVAEARFSNVAFMIDGAHILSPGVFRYAKQACRLFRNPVIGVPQYVLGSVTQNLVSDHAGAFKREQKILDRLSWPDNGYALFRHATMPGERINKNFISAIESNCLITTKAVLDQHGGYDERFDEPGAGLANIELYMRLIHQHDVDYVMLAGEGTFHQDHGGVTTGANVEQRERKVERYRQRFQEVTGSETILNFRAPFLFGVAGPGSQTVPIISHQYARERNRILHELAEVYVERAKMGVGAGKPPRLVFEKAGEAGAGWPVLQPLGLRPEAALQSNRPEKDLNYMTYLRRLHQTLKPKLYFEIGVDTGTSLALSRCVSIGVDPAFEVTSAIAAPAKLFREKSDDFFANSGRCAHLFRSRIDLAFVDGMHLAEYVVRDLINTERWMSPDGVVVVDDVFPEQVEMADRDRRFNAWCGDVYEIIPILRRYRPDLDIRVYNAFIGPYRKGIATISGLDPSSTVLSAHLPEIHSEIKNGVYMAKSMDAMEAMIEPVEIADFDQWLQSRVAERAVS